jgi:hypothetical protein
MSPTQLADRYFECMRSRDLSGLIALFAEDATLALPDGAELAGIQAISEMYRRLVELSPPTPTPLATIAGARSAASEIEARMADGSTRRTANFFHLGEDGRIERLSIYKRGTW